MLVLINPNQDTWKLLKKRERRVRQLRRKTKAELISLGGERGFDFAMDDLKVAMIEELLSEEFGV